MQFTPQQLAGSVSYSDSTRIGNWVEDISLREYQRSHFEVKLWPLHITVPLLQDKTPK